MDYWSGVLGNIVASLVGTLLGAFLGYFGGVKIFRRQLKEDSISKVNMTVNSLMMELEKHQKILDDNPSFKSQRLIIGQDIANIAFSTSSFESIVSSGWFSLLSPRVQEMGSRHYYYCRFHNRALEQFSIDYSQRGRIGDSAPTDMSWVRPERCFTIINEVRDNLSKNITDLIKNLELERK